MFRIFGVLLFCFKARTLYSTRHLSIHLSVVCLPARRHQFILFAVHNIIDLIQYYWHWQDTRGTNVHRAGAYSQYCSDT